MDEDAKKVGAGVELGRQETLREFGAALRRRREQLRLTLDGLAAATGISKPYLSNIETARAPGPPSEEKLDRLAEALGLEAGSLHAAADWLRTPESVRALLGKLEAGGVDARGVVRRADGTVDLDAMVKHKTSNIKHETGQAATRSGAGRVWPVAGVVGLRGVPVINKVAAGKAGEFGDLEYPVNVADSYVPAPDMPGDGAEGAVRGAFAVRVSGDSMVPEYEEGDLVVVTSEEAKDGDDCLVRLGARENFATTLKRVYFERDGEVVVRLRLVPRNPAHATWKVKAEEVTGVYPVVWKVRAMRGNRE